MKNLLSALAVLLAAQAALAYEIDFSFMGTDQETNFTAVVASGEDFTFKGTLTEGRDLTNIIVSRLPDQTAHNSAGLFVGLSESKMDLPLYDEMFGDDAYVIAGYVAGFFLNRKILTDVQVTKDSIRQAIQDHAAAYEKDDIFFFYYSGVISSDAGMALYDDYYTSEEFAEDLSKFKDGVIIIIMLDADNSHLLAGKGIEKDNKNFLMIACDKSLPAKLKKWTKMLGKYMDYASPLTYAMWRSHSCVTDLDGNGLLSFSEYFLRVKAWFASKNLPNEPSLSNQELAEKIYLSPLPHVSGNGRAAVNEDGTFEFTLPNVQSDAVVYLEEGTVNPDFVLSPAKGKISANLKEAGPNYPTRLSVTFNVLDIPEFDFLSLRFGSYFMPFDILLKETERSLTIGAEDYDFNVIAKLKGSIKKEYLQFNLSLKGSSAIANELKFEDGMELVPLQMNCHGALSNVMLPFIKTYKAGKTFSAKLDTRK